MSAPVVDATGVVLDSLAAGRVVSLVPSLTEAVWTLGQGGAIVGVTPYCVEPPEALRRAVDVGGPLGVDLEGVRSLDPDLVLACKEESSKEEVEALRAMGLRVYVASATRVADVPPLLRDLGALVGAVEAAGAAAASVTDAVAAAEARQHARSAPRVTCPVWLDPPRVVGLGTYAADLLRLAGGVVEPSLEGYPTLDPGAVNPEVVLLPDEPYPFAQADVPRLGLAGTDAARVGRVHAVDGRTLFWYGPRSARAIATIARLLERP